MRHCCWLLLWALWSHEALAVLVVNYMARDDVVDKRADYPLAVLRLALAESGVEYDLNPVANISQGRAFKLLQQRQGVDVLFSMTTIERESQLRPIRFPIDKGLIGWRVLLVREAQLPFFAQASTQQLRQLVGGQGHDWPDLHIFKANGFNVLSLSGYEGFFVSLAKDRIGYFPRSVIEVVNELRDHGYLGLAIEPSLLLHYPSASYFFVHPDNEPLAKALEQGLERALANGKFDALFNQMLGPMLAELNIGQRRVIALNNPLLPAATPLKRRELWLQPQDFGAALGKMATPDVRSTIEAQAGQQQ